jgi:hypothetical protein
MAADGDAPGWGVPVNLSGLGERGEAAEGLCDSFAHSLIVAVVFLIYQRARARDLEATTSPELYR